MSGEVRTILLGRQGLHEAKVSTEDYEFLTQWRWTYKVSSWKYGRKIYARRHRRIDGQRVTVLLHDVIMERKGEPRPTELHTVDHINRDSLDNTRDNLRWATKSEQNKNRTRRSRRGSPPELREAA
jgi:hypothetical protein